jgi:hypothetical protein
VNQGTAVAGRSRWWPAILVAHLSQSLLLGIHPVHHYSFPFRAGHI